MHTGRRWRSRYWRRPERSYLVRSRSGAGSEGSRRQALRAVVGTSRRLRVTDGDIAAPTNTSERGDRNGKQRNPETGIYRVGRWCIPTSHRGVTPRGAAAQSVGTPGPRESLCDEPSVASIGREVNIPGLGIATVVCLPIPPEDELAALPGVVVGIGIGIAGGLIANWLWDLLDSDPGWFRIAKRSCYYITRLANGAGGCGGVQVTCNEHGGIVNWNCYSGDDDDH